MSVFENNRSLLDRFRAGERDAMGTVYEHFVTDVETLTRRGFSLGDTHVRGARIDEQGELVQETFVKAFSERARSSFDGLRPYRPFLLRITKNLMIDRLRSQKGARSGDLGDIDDILERGTEFSTIPELDEDLHWAKLSAASAAFVAALDEQTQAIVRMRFEDDVSQDRVCEKLGCSRRRVRTTEAKVRKQLKKHLQSLGLFDE